MRIASTLVIAAFAVGLMGCMQQAASSSITYKAHLTAQAEVPPTTSGGSGDGTFTLDTATKMLTYDVKFSGLTGPATAAHIHGPAAAGANAAVTVPFTGVPSAPEGEIKGSATLTDAQISDLQAGKWYANIHTAANKGGEIRGQITP